MLPRKERVLSPEAFAAILKNHNLDSTTVAHRLGITERLVRRYLDGEKPVPEPTARLLRILTGEAAPDDYI